MMGNGGRDSGALRAVIVDDEPPARDLLAQYLDHIPGIEMVASCRDGFEAVKAITELEPDVVLLDIQMPKLSGFEVLELLEERPQIIFTTAHDEFAIEAFNVAAVDYLLKPIHVERLARALDRVRERLASHQEQPIEQLIEERRRAGDALPRVLVRRGSEVHVLQLSDIDYVEAQDDYIVFHSGGSALRKKQRLAEAERQLGAAFVRIHRSFLLNLDRLQRIEPYAKDSRVAFLDDGTRLPVSRSGYERLRRLL
jgi:two-component system LytT family response regulator